MSDCLNVEYEVMKWETSRLCTGFRSASNFLSRAFYSKGLIATQVEHMCNDSKVDVDTFVATMVSALQDRVKNDPSAFSDIISIIKAENGMSYLGVMLEAKEKEMSERIEAEEKQSEREKMEAEKKKQKLVEDERRNAQLHYKDTTGLEGQRIKNTPPKTQPTSVTQATNHVTHTAEVRNATTITAARSGPVESHMMSQPKLFIDQKRVSRTEEGDVLSHPSSSPGDMPYHSSLFVNPKQSTFSEQYHMYMEGKNQQLNFATGLHANLSHDDLMDTPTNNSTKKIGGNKVTQSSMIDVNAMLERIKIGEELVEEQNEEEEEEESRRYLESRSCRKNSYLSSPREPSYERSISGYSDSSDIYSTPLVSLESRVPSPTVREGMACSHCKFLRRKVDELEHDMREKLELIRCQENKYQTHTQHFRQQAENYRMELNETKQDKVGMCMEYERRLQQITYINYLLELKLQKTEQMNTNKESLVRDLTSEHKKEIKKMKKEMRTLKQEKEWAEKDRVEAEKERDEAEKERDEAEKERDEAEKAKDQAKRERDKERREHKWSWPRPNPHQQYTPTPGTACTPQTPYQDHIPPPECPAPPIPQQTHQHHPPHPLYPPHSAPCIPQRSHSQPH